MKAAKTVIVAMEMKIGQDNEGGPDSEGAKSVKVAMEMKIDQDK